MSGRKVNREIYVTRVEGHWSAYLPRPRYSVSVLAPASVNLADFIMDLREDYPGFKFRCVINKGIERKIYEQYYNKARRAFSSPEKD